MAARTPAGETPVVMQDPCSRRARTQAALAAADNVWQLYFEFLGLGTPVFFPSDGFFRGHWMDFHIRGARGLLQPLGQDSLLLVVADRPRLESEYTLLKTLLE